MGVLAMPRRLCGSLKIGGLLRLGCEAGVLVPGCGVGWLSRVRLCGVPSIRLLLSNGVPEVVC